MIFVAILVLAGATGAALGIVAGTAASKGRAAAIRSNSVLGVAGALMGVVSYGAILAGRRGAFPPDHVINGVAGNTLVVGGLLIGLGLLTGALAAYVILLRGR